MKIISLSFRCNESVRFSFRAGSVVVVVFSSKLLPWSQKQICDISITTWRYTTTPSAWFTCIGIPILSLHKFLPPHHYLWYFSCCFVCLFFLLLDDACCILYSMLQYCMSFLQKNRLILCLCSISSDCLYCPFGGSKGGVFFFNFWWRWCRSGVLLHWIAVHAEN